MADVAGVHLFRTGERVDDVSALVSRLGGAVGLEGVLGDLNLSATVTRVPGRAPVWGFVWDVEDHRSARWFPQGITTSADQGDAETVSGRAVVCTSWYSQDVKGLNKVQGRPFAVQEVVAAIRQQLGLSANGQPERQGTGAAVAALAGAAEEGG